MSQSELLKQMAWRNAMGTASMYGHQVIDVELDSPWMTLPAKIEFDYLGGEENLVELVSVKAYGYDITAWVNTDYMLDLVQEYIDEADYHYSDHGDEE